jgi:RimJ/RimL family protein N-acetyltransferase
VTVRVTAWPLHGLGLRTPSLVLRGMTESDAFALADVVPGDLEHDPRFPSLTSPQKVLRSYWQAFGGWSADDWVQPFTVLYKGVPIGLQALEGKDFAALRVVDTHSWLVPSARSQGFGKQMRAAVLALAFEHLEAVAAVTEAWADNLASLGVSRSLGYVDNGIDLRAHEGGTRAMQRLVLRTWASPFDVGVTGLAPCLPLLGL